MPSGERSQVWYPSVVALLRREWRSDIAWDAVLQLRRDLQAELDGHQSAHGIVRATVRCPDCGSIEPGAPPQISVRALLLALGRFSIEPAERVGALEREWDRRRKERKLDRYGEPVTPDAQPRARRTGHVHRRHRDAAG